MLVKSLTWTLLRPYTKELNRNVLLGITPPRPILRIWDAFQLLIGVRTLDLAWLSRDHGDPLADAYPNGLFPAASSIRLSGVMHYSFAASILYNNPAKLEHLTLDNLQQVGKGCDHFLYRRAKQRQDYYQRPSIWNQKIGHYGPTIPFGPAGPMQNLLGPLTGRCPNLRSLALRKVGQRRHTEYTPEFAAKDEDMYREFAFFIDSVKPTLRHVHFEQGRHTLRRRRPAAGQIVTVAPPLLPATGQIVPVRLPWVMDLRFTAILYPHLFEGHWRYLESMTIIGVNNVGWTDSNRTIQTSHRGDVRAVIVIRKDRGMMDHVGIGDPLAGIIR